jgi:hypothetical protein
MAAFVTFATVTSLRSREHNFQAPSAGRSPGPASGAIALGPCGHGPPAAWADRAARGASPLRPGDGQPAFTAAANRVLAAALAPVLANHAGSIAVGIIDCASGTGAVYGGRRRFPAASIFRADMLAALLLRHQRPGAALSKGEQELVGQMLEESGSAAGSVWRAIGGAAGMTRANQALGLRRTRPGPGGHWNLADTTVRDQLSLLMDLTSPWSPLSAASRSYELTLMRQPRAGQARGVTAAGSAATEAAVQDSWLSDRGLWVVNSVGAIRSRGRELLVAVLCDRQPTKSAGLARVTAAARAAVRSVTAARS